MLDPENSREFHRARKRGLQSRGRSLSQPSPLVGAAAHSTASSATLLTQSHTQSQLSRVQPPLAELSRFAPFARCQDNSLLSASSFQVAEKKIMTDSDVSEEAQSAENKKARAEETELAIEPPKTCLICMRKETRKRPLVSIPCKNNCQHNLVHKKCIFEWKEQLKGKGSCPLCRGKLGNVNYSPPDYLRSSTLHDSVARKVFNLSPVSKKAGMVRCFLKVKNNPWWGSPFLYEFYLQKVGIKKYPHGPVPDNKSPVTGDVFLMSAKKRAQLHSFLSGFTGLNFASNPLSLGLNSCIDISMNNDFDKNGKSYLGNVQASSFTGLEYTVNALIYQDPDAGNGRGLSVSSRLSTFSNASVTAAPSKAAKVHGDNSSSASSTFAQSTEPGMDNRPQNQGAERRISGVKNALKKSTSGLFGRRKQKEVITQHEGLILAPSEVACVHYTQNRVGAESGPRKMKITFPPVSKISRSKGMKALLGNESLPDTSRDHHQNTGASSTGRNTLANQSNEECQKKPKKTMFEDINDFSSDNSSGEEDDEEEEEREKETQQCSQTNFYRPDGSKNSLNRILRRKKMNSEGSSSSQPKDESFFFGKNKEPYWLERIQAYSLDFNGRVTLASNKNFQIELETPDSNVNFSMLNGRENDDIILQFGKVVSSDDCPENVSIYTVDFKYPLSPIQALGICLSSCDRKLACA